MNTIAIPGSVAGICFLPGIIAIWVASRAWHWSLRYAVIFSLIIPALLIEAPDLAIALAAWTSIVFVGVLFSPIIREPALRDSSQPPDSRGIFQKLWAAFASFPQWTLFDLLLFTTTMAGWGLLVSQDFSRQNITLQSAVLVGITFASTSLLGRWFALGSPHWAKRLGVFLGFILLIILAEHFVPAALLKSPLLTSNTWGPRFNFEALMPAAGLNLILAFAFCLFKSYPSQIPEILRRHPDRAKLYKANLYLQLTLFWLVTMLGAISISYLVFQLTFPPVSKKPFDSLPLSGNDFDKLIQIGERFERINLFNGIVQMKPGTTTRNLLTQHANQFEVVQRTLEQPELTWRDWQTPEEFDFSNWDEATASRSIARAMEVKARQESFDGQHDAALESGVICCKLSAPLIKDSILVNSLVAIAIESIGLQTMQRSVATASKDALKDAAGSLAEIENSWPSLEEVIRNDQSIFWYGCNWKGKIAMLSYQELFDDNSAKPVFIRSQVWRDLMRVTLAIERYQRDHNHYPKTLDKLTSKYLDSIPIDPHSKIGSELIYRVNAEGTSYQIYSVGPDQQDDNGKLTYDTHGEVGDINLAEYFETNEKDPLSTMADDPADTPP